MASLMAFPFRQVDFSARSIADSYVCTLCNAIAQLFVLELYFCFLGVSYYTAVPSKNGALTIKNITSCSRALQRYHHA